MIYKSLFLLFLCYSLTQCEISKIKSPRLLSRHSGPTNIFVSMRDGTSQVLAEVKSTLKANSKHADRTTAVYKALTSHAEKSQNEVLQFLKANTKLNIKSFWITNEIYIKNADFALIQELAKMEQVSNIREESLLNIKNVYKGPDKVQPYSQGRAEILAEWGLEKMRVPEVWALQINGTGLIIGNIDTGVRGTHELLKEKWMGDATGWFDPYDQYTAPTDVYNHGTHTMGTLLGDNGIGIAPGARWTSCKGYRDDGTAYQSSFFACGEFMLCPTDSQGNNADCTKAPHVVSNSWGDYGGETYFNPILQAWVTAGILASFSAGNTGPTCSSIYSPADAVLGIAVGATGQSNDLAYFSSVGPSPFGQVLKPDFSAPGVGVYSSSAAGDSSYMSASGTSMSCPNASGVLALMKSADLNLSHEKALAILNQTANQTVVSVGSTCGGVTDGVFPNNHFGSGVVDAYAAVQMVLAQRSLP